MHLAASEQSISLLLSTVVLSVLLAVLPSLSLCVCVCVCVCVDAALTQPVGLTER